MTPMTEQIRQALQNTRQPNRTHGARVRDAVSHTKKSRGFNPAQHTFAQKNWCTTTDKTQKHKPYSSYKWYSITWYPKNHLFPRYFYGKPTAVHMLASKRTSHRGASVIKESMLCL